MTTVNEGQVLVADKKYEGKYVALDLAHDGGVSAHGDDPAQVLKQARAAGIADPIIVFIPESGIAGVY